MGTLKGIEARIKVPETANPKFCKARPVPYAIKPKVDAELDRLVKAGVLEKVETSDWATPILPIPKDNSVRICGDFKVTINPVLEYGHISFAKNRGYFCDASRRSTILQDRLETCISANGGKTGRQTFLDYQYPQEFVSIQSVSFWNRVCSSNVQMAIDQVFQVIPGVQCILDDIIITGKNHCRDNHQP